MDGAASGWPIDTSLRPHFGALLRSIPKIAQPSHTRLAAIPGRPPDLVNLPVGCRFAARCDYAVDTCVADPVAITMNAKSEVRCIRTKELSLRGAE